LFFASHATEGFVGPIFEYKFEKATVKYDNESLNVIAYFENGEEKNYGNPSLNESLRKIELAIDGCSKADYKPLCTPYTAAAHTRLIEKIQTYPIYNVKPNLIKRQPSGKDDQLYIEGLQDIYTECYDKGIMPSELPAYKELIKDDE
jgi:hypothetical protein